MRILWTKQTELFSLRRLTANSLGHLEAKKAIGGFCGETSWPLRHARVTGRRNASDNNRNNRRTDFDWARWTRTPATGPPHVIRNHCYFFHPSESVRAWPEVPPGSVMVKWYRGLMAVVDTVSSLGGKSTRNTSWYFFFSLLQIWKVSRSPRTPFL